MKAPPLLRALHVVGGGAQPLRQGHPHLAHGGLHALTEDAVTSVAELLERRHVDLATRYLLDVAAVIPDGVNLRVLHLRFVSTSDNAKP